MAGIKLNIRTKSKQVFPQDPTTDRTASNKSSETKKSKKSMLFKSSRQGSKQQPSSKHSKLQVLDDSDATDRTDCSAFTIDDGLFSCSFDNSRRNTSNSNNGKSTTRNTRSPSRRPGKRGSWIDTAWDGSFEEFDDNESEDELDDSLYQLLDDDGLESPKDFKKLSLHNILVEEELSFQKSLVWNDEDK